MGDNGAANQSTDIQVFEYLGSWSRHAASWAGRPKKLLLRYEDMLAAPTRTFGAVVRYLGDGPNPARLEKAIAFSRFEVAAAQEARTGYNANAPQAATAFFRNGKAGGWRDVLTPAQCARIEADHGEMMQKAGYEI